MQLLDPNHPFFDPPWRRWAVVGLCVVWSGVEAFMESYGFAALFGALGLYSGWKLLVVRNRADR